MQAVHVAGNQGLLLGSRPFLDLDLAFAGLVHCSERLRIDEGYRASAGGESRSAPGIVGSEASRDIGRRADVVGTAQRRM